MLSADDIRNEMKAAVLESETEDEKKFFERLQNNFDFDAYGEVLNRFSSSKNIWTKYLTLVPWLQKRFRTAAKLGLINTSPAKILDIGCGPSHFGYICSFYGHEVVGVDMPGDEIFEALNEFFNTTRVEHRVEPMQSLPSLGKFDLITAISAAFYHKSDRTLFAREEWEYFLDDLDSHLSPNGRVYLKLNAKRKFQGLKYWDLEFSEMIRDRNGSVDPETGEIIIYAKGDVQ